MSEQEEKRPGTGAVNRLPRGIRGPIRLALVNRRVDHVIENQSNLGKQLQQLHTQMQEQNARLSDALGALHDMLPTINQRNERLGQITHELQSLRARLDRFETYLPQLRASKAPVGR